MQEMPVSTHITGKTLEGNHRLLNMKKSNVPNGKQNISFKRMLMDASMNTDANILMGGRNKNIIHLITKCMLVDKMNSVRNLTVLIIIKNKIDVLQ